MGFPLFGSSLGCGVCCDAAWAFDGVLGADVCDHRGVARDFEACGCAGPVVDELGLRVGCE